MKPVSYPKNLLLLLLAFGLPFWSVLGGQETPPAPPAPSSAERPPAPASAAEEPAEPELRELAPDEPPVAEKAVEADSRRASNHGRNNERVSFGGNSTLAEGEEARSVISIVGSSRTSGTVRRKVVSILGGSRVEGGTVGGEVVSIMGNTYINGEVKGEVVTVMGNVELGPKAVVHGEVVCIGGALKRHPQAVMHGNVQNFAVLGPNFNFSPLTTWLHECLRWGRPLAFHRDLWPFWIVALALLGFYALIALIAPAGVNTCVQTLETRPGSSLLAALLTMLLTPVAYILLALTLAIVVGFVLIPVFTFGLFCAALFGKIVMLAWLGRRFTNLLGDGPLAHPFFAVLIGGAVVLGLYTVPVLGLILYKLLGILGLGVVVFAIISQVKESRPPKPATVAVAVAPAPVAATSFVAPTSPAVHVSGEVAATVAEPMPASTPVPPPVPPVRAPIPAVISAATLPRAGFWIRVAAALLDTILVGMAFGMLDSVFGWFMRFGSFPLWFSIYHVVMWVTKGTTIGGVICGLKVVRIDDRPLDWGVGIVRALGAFLSLAVAGLGFIWVAFDDERQSWHDKIAGTTIVKVPKGTPLL